MPLQNDPALAKQEAEVCKAQLEELARLPTAPTDVAVKSFQDMTERFADHSRAYMRATLHNWTLMSLTGFRSQIDQMQMYFPEIKPELDVLSRLLDEVIATARRRYPRTEYKRAQKAKS